MGQPEHCSQMLVRVLANASPIFYFHNHPAPGICRAIQVTLHPTSKMYMELASMNGHKVGPSAKGHACMSAGGPNSGEYCYYLYSL